jgi:hypothetical protein
MRRYYYGIFLLYRSMLKNSVYVVSAYIGASYSDSNYRYKEEGCVRRGEPAIKT